MDFFVNADLDPDKGFDDQKIVEGRPGYRRSLQLSKENIQHFKP
jgi:hypothetical protein